jgi:hypothetical protein
MSTQNRPKALVIDINRVIGLIRSAAYITSANQFTSVNVVKEENLLEWTFNAISGNQLMEIDMDDVKIREQTEIRINNFLKQLLANAIKGPSCLVDYLARLEKLKSMSNEFLQQKFAMAQESNRKLVSDLGSTIKILAGIKAGSTITVSILGLFTPAGFVISYAQSVGMELAKTIGEAKSADVILLQESISRAGKVAVKSGKDKVIEEAVKKSFDVLSKWGMKQQYAIYKNIRVEMTVKATDAYKATKALAPGATAVRKSAGVMGSKGLKISGKKVPGISIIFAAKSVYDAIKEYQEDTKGL